MNKRILLSAMLVMALSSLFSQAFNTILRDQLDYEALLNDIWGYVAPDGTEYALVGLRNGVSIVSLANPDDVEEVAFIPGEQSIWRDLKSFSEYAYVVADQGTEGLTIIDLSALPDSVTWTHNNLQLPGGGTLNRAHNIYIDPGKGYAYLSGANINGGGMVIYDIASVPGQANFLALAPSIYSHDVYVQDERMYASEINNGRLSIYNVSDPGNITLMGRRTTPFSFTHNAWTTANSNYVFTTDERANAPVAAYDITNPEEPILIDEFRPQRSLGSTVIPHNVHVLDEYLVISYYTDGLEIVDASVPDNLIEVAYYDTWPGSDGGFNGSWGAYPFLPSGLALASDIQTGLYVVEVDYKRAARLKGTIRDADLGTVIEDVSVDLSSPESQLTQTDENGEYRTGIADAGDFTVTFSKPGFQSLTVPVSMENGLEIVLDTVLQSSTPRFTIAGSVFSSANNAGIPQAEVLLVGEADTYTAFANEAGLLTVPFVFEGTYEVYAAKWGFQNRLISNVTVGSGTELSIALDPGFLDGFVIDQGWTTTSTASSGDWVREVPNGTFFGATPSNPGFDAVGPTDIGELAYVTGNAPTDGAGSDDIDNGIVTLTSPVFDPTIFIDPTLSFQYWFFNDGGNPPTNDDLTVNISNGFETVTLLLVDSTTQQWESATFVLSDFIEITTTMQVEVISGDAQNSGHLVEAGFDDFQVSGTLISNTEDVALAGVEAIFFPNPSNGAFNFRYELPAQARQSVVLEIMDVYGRMVNRRSLGLARAGSELIGMDLPAGVYFGRLIVDGQRAYSSKLIKE